MKVALTFYGQTAELVGSAKKTIEFDNEISIGELVRSLKIEQPELKKVELKIAVNNKFESYDTILKNGDEVAVLPPFSGG